MRKGAEAGIGDIANLEIHFDTAERIIAMNAKLATALNRNKKAKSVFFKLPPSRQKEIIRYINSLKTEESVTKNIKKAIGFLTGNERFVGRDKPL